MNKEERIISNEEMKIVLEYAENSEGEEEIQLIFEELPNGLWKLEDIIF